MGAWLARRSRARRSQAGVTLVETLVAVGISAIIIGPVGAWMVLVFTTQAPAAAGFTDSGQSRLLNTYVTRDVSSSERVLAAGDSGDEVTQPAEDLVSCSGAPQGSTSILNLYDLGDAQSVVVYGTVPSPSGASISLVRWTCDLTPSHVARESVELLREAQSAGAVCEDDPDDCQKVTVSALLDTGHETSVTATRRSTSAVGVGGTQVPYPYIFEGTRTERVPGEPMTLDLTAGAMDGDTPVEELNFRWSVTSGDGDFVDPTAQSTTFWTRLAGVYTIELEVDDGVNVVTLPYSVTVGNDVPEIDLDQTSCAWDGLTRRLSCQAEASDPDTDELIDDEDIEWWYPTDAAGEQARTTGREVVIEIPPEVTGSIKVELRVTDAEGGTATTFLDQTVGAPVSGGIEVTPELGPLTPGRPRLLVSTDGDEPLTRTAEFSSPIVESTWQLLDSANPDGPPIATGSGTDFTHVFGQGTSGTFIVRRSGGAVANEEITFRTNTAPNVSFTVSDAQGDFPQTLQFTDTSTDDWGIASWAWDPSAADPFRGTLTSSQQNPGFTFTGPGTYLVELTVTDIDGVSATSAQFVSIPGLAPQPEGPAWDPDRPDYVTFPPVLGAEGYVVTFSYTGDGGSCVRPVTRNVPPQGPFEVRDAGNTCDNPETTEASLAVVANGIAGPSSVPVLRPDP